MTRPPDRKDSVEERLGDARSRLAELVSAAIMGRFSAFYAAMFLGVGGLVLAVAWHGGPHKYLETRSFHTLDARVPAHITESWIAIEFDPAQMGQYKDWRAFARASPCVVVEYDAGWATPLRRAFCGTRLPFWHHYTLDDVRELGFGVPFVWSRDDRGLALPELRMSQAAFDYLAIRPPSALPLDNPDAETQLTGLRVMFDRPVDNGIAGWSRPEPTLTLAFDPANPEAAWPVSYVEESLRRGPDWVLGIMGGIMGLAFWFAGVRIFAGDRRWPVIVAGGALPLLLLPWFTEAIPRAVRTMNADFGQVVTEMMWTVEGPDRFVAAAPADATLARGARIVLASGSAGYPDTFGAIAFKLPDTPPADPDAALLAMADTVAAQMHEMDETSRTDIFRALARDKNEGKPRAGYVFLRAARDAFTDQNASPELRDAAYRFLDIWVTQPVEEPDPARIGFGGRVQLLRELTQIPPPNDIATRAGWIVSRADAARPVRK